MIEASAKARSTVICAVWHRDALRHALLQGHQRNLDGQSVAVERIYVFDGDDPVPADLDGTCVRVNKGLTIYQAWNVALSLVSTPYVMNLNLDDRLAPDAVQKFEAALDTQTDVAIVGGDWQICFSQDATDTVRPCYAMQALPFRPDWPPVAFQETRLGSGDGARGTLGPACLWRMSAHIQAPRYPWRFSDGTTIKTIADALWWFVIQNHLKMKVARVPLIVGNYYSHPDAQAEFRNPGANEHELFNKVGLSLL